MRNFFFLLNSGMHRYKPSRKVFTYIVTIVPTVLLSVVTVLLTILQFIDLQASTDIAKHVFTHSPEGSDAIRFYARFGGLLTTPWATSLSLITLAVFSFTDGQTYCCIALTKT